jgi:transcriptional regulator with XRE-family HTH domain
MNEEDFITNVGEKIKHIRLLQNVKQIDLAFKVGIEDSSLRRIETGRTNPTLKTLIRISNALEIDIKELF